MKLTRNMFHLNCLKLSVFKIVVKWEDCICLVSLMLFIDTLSGLFELVKLKGRISDLLNSRKILIAAYN